MQIKWKFIFVSKTKYTLHGSQIGKTTFSEWNMHAAAAAGRIHTTIFNFNKMYQIGVCTTGKFFKCGMCFNKYFSLVERFNFQCENVMWRLVFISCSARIFKMRNDRALPPPHYTKCAVSSATLLLNLLCVRAPLWNVFEFHIIIKSI